jgi:hypothetical protein
VQGDERLRDGDQRAVIGASGSCVALAQRDDRQDADDADDDERRLQQATGDVAKGDARVLAPDHRIQRDPGADDADGDDDLEEAAQQDARVRAGTEDGFDRLRRKGWSSGGRPGDHVVA